MSNNDHYRRVKANIEKSMKVTGRFGEKHALKYMTMYAPLLVGKKADMDKLRVVDISGYH